MQKNCKHPSWIAFCEPLFTGTHEEDKEEAFSTDLGTNDDVSWTLFETTLVNYVVPPSFPSTTHSDDKSCTETNQKLPMTTRETKSVTGVY